jgi:hypothetical protein
MQKVKKNTTTRSDMLKLMFLLWPILDIPKS